MKLGAGVGAIPLLILRNLFSRKLALVDRTIADDSLRSTWASTDSIDTVELGDLHRFSTRLHCSMLDSTLQRR